MMTVIKQLIDRFASLANEDMKISGDELQDLSRVEGLSKDAVLSIIDSDSSGEIDIIEWFEYKTELRAAHCARSVLTSQAFVNLKSQISDDYERFTIGLLYATMVANIDLDDMLPKGVELYLNLQSWLSDYGFQKEDVFSLVCENGTLLGLHLSDYNFTEDSFKEYLSSVDRLGLYGDLRSQFIKESLSSLMLWKSEDYFNGFGDMIDILQDRKIPSHIVISFMKAVSERPDLLNARSVFEMLDLYLSKEEVGRLIDSEDVQMAVLDIYNAIQSMEQLALSPMQIRGILNVILTIEDSETILNNFSKNFNAITELDFLSCDPVDNYLELLLVSREAQDPLLYMGFDSGAAEWLNGLPIGDSDKMMLLREIFKRGIYVNSLLQAVDAVEPWIKDDLKRLFAVLPLASKCRNFSDLADSLMELVEFVDFLDVSEQGLLQKLRDLIINGALAPGASSWKEIFETLRKSCFTDAEIVRFLINCVDANPYGHVDIVRVVLETSGWLNSLGFLDKQGIKDSLFEMVGSDIAFCDFAKVEKTLSEIDLSPIAGKLSPGEFIQFVMFLSNSDFNHGVDDLEELLNLCIEARDKFGITYFGRYSKKIFDSMLSDHDESKPLALIVHPYFDYNGAFYNDREDLENMINHEYRLMIVEVSTEDDIYSRLDQMPEGSISAVLFGAHGTRYGAVYSRSSSVKRSERSEGQQLDDGDDEWSYYVDKLVPNARWINFSCSTGEGGDQEYNVFSMFRRWFAARPDVVIYAPNKPSSGHIGFDEDGKIYPIYSSDAETTTNLGW